MPDQVLKKLLLKPGQKAATANVPKGYAEKVSGLPPSVEIASQPPGALDWLLLFVANMEEVDALAPKAVKAMRPDGLLWISYPKGGAKAKTDLNRDILWAAMGKHDLAGVAMVSLDEVWSAMRFRPADKVGK